MSNIIQFDETPTHASRPASIMRHGDSMPYCTHPSLKFDFDKGTVTCSKCNKEWKNYLKGKQ